ncbi:hypothetical protein F5Y11DRAFT_7453 [Daldinia sp. FL1419]|nr:hypothetical protein F5Y11DRAFT_7453 [Daldinia sp. FL1419]
MIVDQSRYPSLNSSQAPLAPGLLGLLGLLVSLGPPPPPSSQSSVSSTKVAVLHATVAHCPFRPQLQTTILICVTRGERGFHVVFTFYLKDEGRCVAFQVAWCVLRLQVIKQKEEGIHRNVGRYRYLPPTTPPTGMGPRLAYTICTYILPNNPSLHHSARQLSRELQNKYSRLLVCEWPGKEKSG